MGYRNFATPCATRDALETVLGAEAGMPGEAGGAWNGGGKLLLSMGMSGDFEALRARSGVLRVGTGDLRREAASGKIRPVFLFRICAAPCALIYLDSLSS